MVRSGNLVRIFEICFSTLGYVAIFRALIAVFKLRVHDVSKRGDLIVKLSTEKL